MKSINKRTIIVIMALFMTLLLLSSCNNHVDPINIVVSGDIEDFVLQLDLTDIDETAFAYEDGIERWGYNLRDVLDGCSPYSEENWVLLTASDNLSSRIDYSSIGDVWLQYTQDKDKGGQIDVKAPNHPRAVGIKDLIEITIISKSPIDHGLKIVREEATQVLSFGNVKLGLYDMVAENISNDNLSYKHTLKDNYKVKDLTENDLNIVYFDNKDIIKDNGGTLIWSKGKLSYSCDDKVYNGVSGIVSGIENVLFDAYYEMQDALKNNERVMFILPDGLSLEQVKHYKEDLTLFGDGYTPCASVNPAISNVSLAAMVSGLSPYDNGIIERGVKQPNGLEIFDYALELGKNVIYIEGDGNLIATNLKPILNYPDANGYTDTNVYNSAKDAIGEEPDLLFVHFHGIDDVNHQFSPISSQAKAKILKVEGYIMELIEMWDGRVIILPDHGHITYYDNENNAKGHHGFFETNDMLVPYYIID